MRRGAIVAALAAVVLLAGLFAQRWTMGSCDFEQKIITPDGHEFVLQGSRLSPGSPESDWPLEEGQGLPQVEHLEAQIYMMPGALYKGTIVKSRLLTVVSTLHGVSTAALMDIRAKMQAALRWDRSDQGKPSIYRITVNGVSRDLYVRYDSSVERRIGRPGNVAVVAIRLIAHDPLFYSPVTEEQVLDWQDTFSMRLVMAREGGIWNPLGPPTGAGVGIVATDIYATAVDPLTGDVYFGGDFCNFDGDPLADFLVRWRKATSTWEPVGDNGAGGPALTERVECLYFGPDNRLYVGGRFVNAGGVAAADYIAVVDVTTDTWAAPAAAPNEVAGRIVYDCLVGSNGRLYVVGNFTNWSGLGSPAGDYIASATLGGAWATVGNGLNGMGYCLAKAPNGDIVVGGAFTTAGGAAHNRIAWRDLSAGAWVAMEGGFPSGGSAAWNAEFAPDGSLYVTGNIPQMGSAAATAYNFVKWNGVSWSNCGTGLNNIGYGLVVDSDGSAYVTGAFTTAGGLVVDRLGRWNGHSWAYVDAALPVTGNIYRGIAIAANGDLYFGCREVGTATVAGDNSVINAGNAFTLPIIEVKNAGTLKTLVNETTGKELMFALTLRDGEIVTIDLSSGVKSCESTWRGNCLGDILPASDMATFCLESFPRANYGGVEGANLVTVFITGADPRLHNDTLGQMGSLQYILGISQSNSDYGKLYFTVVATGGGFYRADVFMDAVWTQLVAHTASYNVPSSAAIIPDNNSGLGGAFWFTPSGADADIYVYFTIVTLNWRARWWDLDSAVS